MHELRDAIYAIKRYLYRRIIRGAFSDHQNRDVRFIDRIRLWAWLLPQGVTEPTKTEVYCLNNRPMAKLPSGGGTPAIFFPTPKRAWEMFSTLSYERLKKRVLSNGEFPGRLLDGLLGKSSTEPCASKVLLD